MYDNHCNCTNGTVETNWFEERCQDCLDQERREWSLVFARFTGKDRVQPPDLDDGRERPSITEYLNAYYNKD